MPTKFDVKIVWLNIYIICFYSDDLVITQRSQLRIKVDKCFTLYFNSNLSENSLKSHEPVLDCGHTSVSCIMVTQASRARHVHVRSLLSQCLLSERAFGVQTVLKSMAFTLGMTVDLGIAYMLMIVPMTLTLMQGRSGSAKANNQRCRQLSRQMCKQ